MITKQNKSGRQQFATRPRERPESVTPRADGDLELWDSSLLVGTQVVQPLWKMVWWFFTKLNGRFPYHTEIVAPGARQRDLKTHVPTHTHTRMFTAAFVMIGTMISFSRWRDKPVHPANETLLISEKKRAVSHEKTWRDLKRMRLSERSPRKVTKGMIPTLWRSGKGKTLASVTDQWLPGAVVGGGTNRWRQRVLRAAKLFCPIL